jgi:phosphoglycolate phosphatase-like HAD superfamily hydrolase
MSNYLESKVINNKIMIGDGIPDMTAGKANNCVCLGIGHSLINNGADFTFEEGIEYDKLADELVHQITRK